MLLAHADAMRMKTPAVLLLGLVLAGTAATVVALDLGGDDKPTQANKGAAEAEVFGYEARTTIRPLPLFSPSTREQVAVRFREAELNRCFGRPGLSESVVLFRDPPIHTGLVTGRSKADSFKRCVDDVPGWSATITAKARAGS